jgi:hypothetical protein
VEEEEALLRVKYLYDSPNKNAPTIDSFAKIHMTFVQSLDEKATQATIVAAFSRPPNTSH